MSNRGASIDRGRTHLEMARGAIFWHAADATCATGAMLRPGARRARTTALTRRPPRQGSATPQARRMAASSAALADFLNFAPDAPRTRRSHSGQVAWRMGTPFTRLR